MLRSRNLVVSGRRTSIRLEPQIWDAFQEIARREGHTISELVALIDKRRRQTSLTAAIRAFIVTYYRAAATDSGHANAGHGRLDRGTGVRGRASQRDRFATKS